MITDSDIKALINYFENRKDIAFLFGSCEYDISIYCNILITKRGMR